MLPGRPHDPIAILARKGQPMSSNEQVSPESGWRPSACILCECNCGIEIELGGADGRRFERIRGDKAHPSSAGYACEKPSRLDYYQNDPERLTTPLRRRADGSFEAIDWETAIREVAERLAAIRDQHGGDSIFYYGGGVRGIICPPAIRVRCARSSARAIARMPSPRRRRARPGSRRR